MRATSRRLEATPTKDDFKTTRPIADVIARALADESEGRESLSASPERQKTGTAGTLAEAFFSRARACAGAGDWPAALLDADGALARRGLWLEPHVVRAQALEDAAAVLMPAALALCAAAMSHPAVGWPPSAVVDILGYGMAATSVASLGLYAREGLAKASRCGVGRQLVFIILFLTCSAR